MSLKKWTIAIVVGVVVFFLVTPWYGVDTNPPKCWSMFDYEVPCNRWISVAAGLCAAAVASVVLWALGRQNGDRL